MNKKNIVLVGFMGTGKTSVGKILSKKLNLPLVDMDSLIETKEGKSINSIFADDGEAHFRALERQMTQKLANQSGQIISTGGGIVLNQKNINDYKKNGLVICLTASPEIILKRLKNDQSRPLLANDKEQSILQLLETRKSLYGAIPNQLDTTQLNPETIATKIIALYETNLEFNA